MSRGGKFYSETGNSGTDGHFIQIFDGAGATQLKISLGDFILKADYSRNGADLVLSGEDGAELLIQDYFSNATLPDLVSENGSLVEGGVVDRLAGPLAPGQYAQAAQTAQNAIGVVEDAFGQVTAQLSTPD